MTEFRSEIKERIAAVQEGLAQARETGDHYLAEVLLGELESLGRLAAEHGVEVNVISLTEPEAAEGPTAAMPPSPAL